MAKKSLQDGGADAVGQGNYGDAPPAASRGSLLTYAVIIAVAAAVMALAYYSITGSGGQGLSSRQIFSDMSNSTLNQTQALFVNDLERSENLSSLMVSYTTGNGTIDSYKMGDYNKTVISSTVEFGNLRNVNSTYYYDTNTTVTCFNDTAYSGAQMTNSSLQCFSGDQGLSYLEETPFTAANVSALSYHLVFNNTVTYEGTKSMAGRDCDYFVISNATGANLRSNYSVFDLCIDPQYGIPLYLNETYVSAGVPSSIAFIATAVSANVSGSEFVIPQQYLNALPKSII